MFRRLPTAILCLAAMAPPALADPPLADPTAEDDRGARLVETCARCHALAPHGKRKWGPNLFGIVDRPVGQEAGYRYGSYLRAQEAAGARWDEASLRDWLVDSKAMAREAGARTKMPSQRFTDAQLDDLVAYLRTLK